MIDDSHLFDDCKPVTEIDVLLRIEKKLDKLIDLMSKNASIISNKGMKNGDEYGHSGTETKLREYQELLKDLYNEII